jgi:SSS family transporter
VRALDWAVLLAYGGLLVLLGWRASRGARSAESHLRADRSLPAWAVIFSVLATEISAATYIGVPESAYRGDWTYLQFAIGALLGKWVLSTWFIRLYWRLDLPTVYGFLGRRIGPGTQRASALAFLVGRLIASGVRLFIAALAFSVVTGFSLEGAIVVMSALSTLYTLLGGLRAVVWTDVAQGSIFAIGAAVALGVGLAKLGLPVGQVLGEAWDAGKLQVLAFGPGEPGWLASVRPLPVAVLGGFFLTLASHGTDQENVQYLLNTRSERASARTIVGSGLITFPIVALFLSVGTMLWAFHRHVPVEAYAPDDTRRIFPNFIMHVLPAGVRGLVFAGLFAAAISSLGATVSATTAAWLADLRPGRAAGLLRVRLISLVFGALLGLVGLFFAWYSRGSGDQLVQIALGAMTILYGGILGGFLVALLFERRGDDLSVSLGMAAGVLAGAALFFQVELFGLGQRVLEWPWFIPISAALAVGVGITRRRPR